MGARPAFPKRALQAALQEGDVMCKLGIHEWQLLYPWEVRSPCKKLASWKHSTGMFVTFIPHISCCPNLFAGTTCTCASVTADGPWQGHTGQAAFRYCKLNLTIWKLTCTMAWSSAMEQRNWSNWSSRQVYLGKYISRYHTWHCSHDIQAMEWCYSCRMDGLPTCSAYSAGSSAAVPPFCHCLGQILQSLWTASRSSPPCFMG